MLFRAFDGRYDLHTPVTGQDTDLSAMLTAIAGVVLGRVASGLPGGVHGPGRC